MLFTLKEAAEYLRLSPSTVRDMCRRRNPVLAHSRVGPRHGRIVIEKSECDRHLAAGKVERRSETSSHLPRVSSTGYVYRSLEPGKRRKQPASE
jgi:excisionase family DNA binding protein